IENLPALRDLPGLDRVIVIRRSRTTHFAQLAITWLNKTGAVDGTALQDDGRTVPYPINVETRQAFVQHGGFEARGLPALAAIERHIDLLDLSATGPCQAADVIKTLAHQGLATRRRGDH